MSGAALLTCLRAVGTPGCGAAAAAAAYGAVLASVCQQLDAGGPEPGLCALSLQELALLSLLQDVVSAQCLLPCVLGSGMPLGAVLDARFARCAPSLAALGVRGEALEWLRRGSEARRGADAGGAGAATEALAVVVAGSVRLLCHAELDARLVGKHLPEALAGALLLRRQAHAAGSAALAQLTAGLPPQALASALLLLASGRVCADEPPPAAPPAPAAQAQGQPLRAAAAAELSRLCMRPLGVESIALALLHSVDSDNPAAMDRVRRQVAAVLCPPPLELATAEAYYCALGPQLQALLRLAGGRVALHLADTAALTLASLLRLVAREAPPAHAQHVWRGVIAPLLAPLLGYTDPGAVEKVVEAQQQGVEAGRGSSDSALLPMGATLLFSENAVLSCVEDLHKVFTAAAPSSGVALQLLPVLPALFDLYTAYRGSKLRAGSSASTKELLVSLLKALPPEAGALAFTRILSLPALEMSWQQQQQQRQQPAQQRVSAWQQALAMRHPCMALVLGDSAGYALARFPWPVSRTGERLAEQLVEDRPALLLHRQPALATAAPDAASGGMRGGLAGLLHLNPRAGGLGGQAAASKDVHSMGIQGLDAASVDGAARANSLVDVLGALPRSAATAAAAAAAPQGPAPSTSAAGVLFSLILGWQARSLAGGGRDGKDGSSSGERVRILQLGVCLTERLSARLLHSEIECIMAVRHALSLTVHTLALPMPTCEDAGCGGPHTEASKIHLASLQPPSTSASSTAECEETAELISTCMGLLTVLLASDGEDMAFDGEEAEGGVVVRGPAQHAPAHFTAAKEAWLRSMLPLLACLCAHPLAEISEVAAALRALLLTSHTSGALAEAVGPAPAAAPVPQPSRAAAAAAPGAWHQFTSLHSAMQLVMDPDPAILAHGLRALAQAVTRGALGSSASGQAQLRPEPAAAAAAAAAAPPAVSAILDLALNNLESHDSFVYLAAVDLLQALIGAHATATFPRLLLDFSGGNEGAAGPAGGALARRVPPTRVRVKLGEVLTLASRNAGASGVLAVYAPALLGCLLKVGPGGWRVQEALAARLLHCSSGSSSSDSAEAAAALAPLPPSALALFPPGTAARDMWAPYNVALALKDAAELRQSALSALGEVASHLGAALGAHSTAILTGLCGVVGMERDPFKGKGAALAPAAGAGAAEGEEAVRLVREAAAGARRAAVLALRLLLQGRRALVTLCGEGTMSEVYRLLTSAAQDDPDSLVRAHAQDAMAFVQDAAERLAPRGAEMGERPLLI